MRSPVDGMERDILIRVGGSVEKLEERGAFEFIRRHEFGRGPRDAGDGRRRDDFFSA